MQRWDIRVCHRKMIRHINSDLKNDTYCMPLYGLKLFNLCFGQSMVPHYRTTSGYATMVHGRGCNPHRCTTTFANDANVEITSLWRHWWRHNSRDRQKRRPPRAMKSSELSNGENRIALQQLSQNLKSRHLWRHNLGSRWKLQKMARENFSIGALYNITNYRNVGQCPTWWPPCRI